MAVLWGRHSLLQFLHLWGERARNCNTRSDNNDLQLSDYCNISYISELAIIL